MIDPVFSRIRILSTIKKDNDFELLAERLIAVEREPLDSALDMAGVRTCWHATADGDACSFAHPSARHRSVGELLRWLKDSGKDFKRMIRTVKADEGKLYSDPRWAFAEIIASMMKDGLTADVELVVLSPGGKGRDILIDGVHRAVAMAYLEAVGKPPKRFKAASIVRLKTKHAASFFPAEFFAADV